MIRPRKLGYITSAIFMVGAWLAPNHYQPWVVAHSEILAALALLCLVNTALILNGVQKLVIPKSALFLLITALIPIAQAVTGHIYFFGDGWIAWMYLTASGIAVFAARAAAVQHRSPLSTGCAVTLVTGSLLSIAITWVQQLRLNVGPLAGYIATVKAGNAPFANLEQPNQLASLIGLGLIGIWYLYENQEATRFWAIVAAGVSVATLAITQSRTPLLFFVMLIFAHRIIRRRLSLKTPPWFVQVLTVLWFISFILWPSFVNEVFSDLTPSAISRMHVGPRLIIWSQLLDAVWLRPWFGFGWNQVSVAQVGVALDHASTRYVEHSHNILLDLLIWNGIPIGLLLIATSVIWIYRRVVEANTLQATFPLLIIGILFSHSMVEFPLDYLYFLFPLGVAIGLVEASRPNSTLPIMVLPGVLWGFNAMFATLSIWAAIDYFRVEEIYREMRFSVARIGRSLNERPLVPLKTQFSQLAAFHQFVLTVPQPGMKSSELAWMRQVSHRYAYSSSLFRYALTQALNDDLAGAKITLAQLKKLHGDIIYTDARQEFYRLGETTYPALNRLILER